MAEFTKEQKRLNRKAVFKLLYRYNQEHKNEKIPNVLAIEPNRVANVDAGGLALLLNEVEIYPSTTGPNDAVEWWQHGLGNLQASQMGHTEKVRFGEVASYFTSPKEVADWIKARVIDVNDFEF